MTPELSESSLGQVLNTRWLGRNYHYIPETGSTNGVLQAMLDAGDTRNPPAGTVILADYQSQGRGRLQRTWIAPPGSSLLLSLLFRPLWPVQQSQWLMICAALAAADAIHALTDLTPGIKWPNDLVLPVEGEWRKVSGLLLETQTDRDGRLKTAILGIGINVNIPRENLPTTTMPATSLLAAGGVPIPRLALLVEFLQRVEAWYGRADQGESPLLAWKQRLVTLGREVAVFNASGEELHRGTAVNVDEWGRLVLFDTKGRSHAITAGDVTLRS